MRAARKPSAVARELLRNFPKSGGRRRRRKRKGGSQDGSKPSENGAAPDTERDIDEVEVDETDVDEDLEAAEAGDES
jgi:hypothetical protein